MTPEEIAESRRICDALPPPPWEACSDFPMFIGQTNGVTTQPGSTYPIINTGRDFERWAKPLAEFIAHARTALPAALDDLEAAAYRVAELEDNVLRLLNELAVKDARIVVLEEDLDEMKDTYSPEGSWFWQNCRRQRKDGAKICQSCPFREGIEAAEGKA